jgi:hypothetical protein
LSLSVQHQQLFQGAAGAIHPAVEPLHADIVITKHRISAFAGTDLDMILRAKDIDTFILFGIATSGVVLTLCFIPVMPTTASSLSRIAASIWIQKFTLLSSRKFSSVEQLSWRPTSALRP